MSIDVSQLDLSHLAPSDRIVLEEYLARKALREKGETFLSFAKHVMPTFVVEEVHVLIARHFELLRSGEIDRLMIQMPPRTGKSLMTSELLPAWWAGHFPKDKILHTSYASTLVEKFGRKIRNMLAVPDYHEIFPKTILSKDSKSAAQWATTLGGEYNAVGVGGGVAGKGGNLLLVDDPINEQDMFSNTVMDNVYAWYGFGFYTRRQPDRNAMVITMTRWKVNDLVGRLLADSVTNPGADQWTVLKIPAICDEETADLLNDCSDDPHIDTPHFYQVGDSFSPRRWSLEELQRTKNTITRKAWASLYLQSPTEEEGGILLREWWKPWSQSKPLPEIEYTLQSYDTAFEEGETNDYSARTTWGVFKRARDGKMCTIIMERMKERLDFPKLLESALDSHDEYHPDRIIVEKAASGAPLIQEMRKRGIPVTPIKPIGSKIARANAATILFEQGCVYYPEGRKWALEVIDDCAEFPNSAHDDVCFIGGTLVATPQGEKAISSVRVGDMVSTPFGPRRVIKAGETGRRLVRLYGLVSGGALVGTANHPVFSATQNKFIPLDNLSSSDILVRNLLTQERQSWGLRLKVWYGLKLWSLRGASIAGIRILRESTRRSILGALVDSYTEMFGFRPTAPYLPSTTYTTSTGTQGITELKTWHLSPAKTTHMPTACPKEAAPLSTWHISQVSKAVQKRGTPLQKESSGTVKTPRLVGLAGSTILNLSKIKFVLSAASTMWRGLRGQCTAALSALGQPVVGAIRSLLCAWTSRAKPAARSLWVRKATPDSAQSSAEKIFITTCSEPFCAPVFNLQVEGVRCYYANGILVHNCDTVTQALVFLRRMFLLETPDDESDEDDPDEYDPAQAQTTRSYARRQSRLPTPA